YFNSHAFHSVTTEDFLADLDKNLLKGNKQLRDSLKVDEWIYQPGLPSNAPVVSSLDFTSVDSLISDWKKTGTTSSLTKAKRSTNVLIYLIRHLPENISIKQMAEIDREFKFTSSGNAEIQAAWYALAIRQKYTPAYPAIENFLTDVGRRKFLTPLYKEMIKTPEGKEWAKKVYAKARPNYHSVAYHTLDDLLK
ncbi:MAG: leukotriene A4 hydrolase C-terminal domain-containing protein, partial [Pyrinomonadaceae bacterium]|nr:leukotriene A4 hydrolase C-terminal domain-containing protein [Sphingobacteriaceae bacterium]